jgi:hypothetical protein
VADPLVADELIDALVVEKFSADMLAIEELRTDVPATE